MRNTTCNTDNYRVNLRFSDNVPVFLNMNMLDEESLLNVFYYLFVNSKTICMAVGFLRKNTACKHIEQPISMAEWSLNENH